MEKELILNNLLDSLINFINSYSLVTVERYFPLGLYGAMQSDQINDILYVVLDEKNNIINYFKYDNDTVGKIFEIIKFCEIAGKECDGEYI